MAAATPVPRVAAGESVPSARVPVEDRCPGVVRIHQAADGGLARVRLPGGLATSAQLAALADAAARLGDGTLELTSRGNIQLRALPPGVENELAGRLASIGLLPSATHERVRNIVASPLAGIDTPDDLTPLVLACDAALRGSPRLAELPGRFLIALDDGRRDVARLDADVTVVMRGPCAHVGVLELPAAQAVRAVVALATAFLDERAAQGSAAWRIHELDGGLARVCQRAHAVLPESRPLPDARKVPPDAAPPSAAIPEPVGPIHQADGGSALAVLAPLGRLTTAQAGLLTGLAGPRGLRVTPWRSIVVPDVTDLAAAVAAAGTAGLGVDMSSPWYRQSACAGRPGCTRALADVRGDAAATPNRWPGRQVRWSGCERRCGRPADTEVDVVATPDGYQIHERAVVTAGA